ncbi:MAG: twin-arginine translocation signal domain-containing protein [Verrucomicrobia bacterium]|nr:twin-arginine translocation signal domain-containing protein [Verrucomicrobiota bacterium]
MKTTPILQGCACCPMNRRNFLTKTGAATAGALGLLASPSWLAAAEPTGKTRIRILYSLHGAQQAGPDWPNKGFDFQPVMDRINTELGRRLKRFEFVPSLATGPEQAKKILDEDTKAGGIDGYLVYQMNCWNRVVQTMATSGKPVLYADFQFGGSGGFLVYNAGFLRSKAPNVGFVASSEIKDLVQAVECFEVVKKGGSPADFVAATAQVRLKRTPKAGRLGCKQDDLKCLSIDECLKRLKESKILAVRGQESGPAGEILGIKVVHVPFAEVNDAWKNADKDETRAVADLWQKTAKKVEGVSRETLETSAAMYLAEKAVMKKHGAQGITINCLGGFYGGHIHAYPCLGFHQLNNEALVGGCECDVRSAATMLIGTTLTQGRPGYISDPVIDTSKRQIIYAHCVAANKAFGPQGAANPFHILTHSEDRQGASVRSFLPTGYMTTTLEFEQSRKEILFHRGKAVANDPDDRACRTKLCAEPVGDIEKLFAEWDQWGWHRVTFYGDLKEPIHALADAIGWKVREEA